MIAFGHKIAGSPIHRLERRTWPERYVVTKHDKGWNRCELCQREHRIWTTADAIWATLPRKLRKMRLCVGCFRKGSTMGRETRYLAG